MLISLCRMKTLGLISCVFLGWSYGAYAQICRSSCMSTSAAKQRSLERFAAQQRAILCERAVNMGECAEILGLGAVAGLLAAKHGLQAHGKVRNPKFHFCPMKGAFRYFPISVASIVNLFIHESVATAGCVDHNSLRHAHLTAAHRQAVQDLDDLMKAQKAEMEKLQKSGFLWQKNVANWIGK